jgi:hypothetical protein
VAVIVNVPLATVFALDVFVRHMLVLDGCMIVLVGVGRRQVLDIVAASAVDIVRHVRMSMAMDERFMAVRFIDVAGHETPPSFGMPSECSRNRLTLRCSRLEPKGTYAEHAAGVVLMANLQLRMGF